MVSELDVRLIEATREVFGTMLGWTVEPSPTQQRDQTPRGFALRAINGHIGFGGQLTGSLFLSVSERLAQRISQQILGEHVAASDISDVIGELTNMLAGGCKTRLVDAGYAMAMSIPNIIRGQEICARGKDVEFVIKVDFVLPAHGEDFEVFFMGKVNQG